MPIQMKHQLSLAFALVLWLPAMPAIAAPDYAQPGPYEAGWRQVSVQRPGGGSFNALLFYPAEAPGQNAPLDGSGGPYPAVSFGHGFLQPPTRYTSILQHLASWGYLTIATESSQSLFPNHANYAEELSLCLTFLETEHASPGSWLEGAVDTGAFGISGHSMGGGASMLAAAQDPRIAALATLAPANTNPSAIAAAAGVTIPVRLIVGTNDSITPTASHGRPMYDNGLGPRQLIDIQGGWHCGFQDSSVFGCDSGPMSRADQLALSRALLTEFFELHLRADEAAWAGVWGPGLAADPRLIALSESLLQVEAGPALRARDGFPTQVALTITSSDTDPRNLTLRAESADFDLAAEPASIGPIAPAQPTPATYTLTISGTPGDTGKLLITATRPDGAGAWVEIDATLFCPADTNTDGVVDADDFFGFLALFAAADPAADFNADGVIDADDFFAFLAAFADRC